MRPFLQALSKKFEIILDANIKMIHNLEIPTARELKAVASKIPAVNSEKEVSDLVNEAHAEYADSIWKKFVQHAWKFKIVSFHI